MKRKVEKRGGKEAKRREKRGKRREKRRKKENGREISDFSFRRKKRKGVKR
jgi:hypothetical protein